MRVLVACEYSGRVRDAFIARGHDAWSCDLLDTDVPGPHWTGDVLELLDGDWDLMVAFPPCTHLSVSGARWWKDKLPEQAAAIAFVKALYDCPIPRVAIENPVGKLSSAWRKPDQIIHPWQHGHGETKQTCLWLKNLPKIQPTNVVEGREPKVHFMAPSPDRWKQRSLTYSGIAQAMADQWGDESALPPIAEGTSVITA